MRVVDFKTSGYFSWTIIFLGIVLVLAGLVVVSKTLILGLILFLVGLTIFTTHYRLTIDFNGNVFHDYVWILGMKFGDKGKFETIEYLFIKKNKVSQRMNHMVLSSTIQKEVYDGYLKFSEKDKVHLATKDNRKDLVRKLRVISTALKLKIIDFRGGPKRILRLTSI